MARPRITGPRSSSLAVPIAVFVATVAGIVLLVGPLTGTDLAAQDARAAFAGAHPGAAVDLRWYGGVLPAAYSVVAPYVEAVVGVRLTGIVAAVIGAGLLAALLVRWNVRRPIAAGVWGAIAMVANIVSGRVAFGLGMTIALGALLAVPPPGAKQRRWIAPLALAAVATATSAVAAAFLALIAVAWAVRRRDVAILVAPVVVGGGALALLFPEYGHMPFAWIVARPVLLACLGVFVVCPSRPIRAGTALYAIATVIAYYVSTPMGANVERLALLFAGLVVLASSPLRTPILVVAVAIFVQWSDRVVITDLSAAHGVQVERAAAHRLVAILNRLGPATGRVEVVPFVDHSEADIVAMDRPLARGWERQVDTSRAAVLYRRNLDASTYLAWLRANAVQYVALGRHRHDWSTHSEIRVLSDGVAGLDVVYSDAEWTVWRVDETQPLVTGGQLVSFGADRVTFTADGTQPVTVAIRWSRWLSVSSGACLRRLDADDVTVLPHRAGVFTLSSSYLAPFDEDHC